MFILCGKTCSGKDTIAKELIKRGFHRITTETTRPKRPGEKQGEAYIYVSDDEFDKKLLEGFYIEHNEYNTTEGVWRYGSPLKEILEADKKSFAILSPSGVNEVLEKINPAPLVIYIYANNKTIRERLHKRGDSTEEGLRRVYQDNIDFSNMPNIADRIVYNNQERKIDDVVCEVIEFVIGNI